METTIKIQKVLQSNISKGQTNFKKAPKSRITLQYVETRLEVLQNYWDQFEENHYKLLAVVDDEGMVTEPYFRDNMYENVEEMYIDYKSELKQNIAVHKESTSKDPSWNKQLAAVKLPKIILPIFSGQYMEWPTFHDLFDSMIHQSDSLADVQKLHYLKSHLAGEAEQLLRHIPVTDANYISCWMLLKKRYNNKRYIANCILTRLVNQKALTAESANGVKLLLDTTSDCLNALANIGVDVSTWDILIIHLIAQKLDSESRKQWEQKISDVADKLPTLLEFKKFLESRFRALEFIEPKQKKDIRQKDNYSEKSKINSFKVTTFSCPFCSEDHLLYQCKKFNQEDFESRHEFVQRNNLCFNCFGANHSVAQCKRSTSCRRCHKRHHSLLHPDASTGSQSHIVTHEPTPEGQEGLLEGNEQTNTNNIVTHFAKGSVLSPGHVMLATTLIKLESKQTFCTIRALLDQGSQASFITENVVQMLGLRKIPVSGVVSGLGGDQLNLKIKHKVNCKIQSTCTSFSYVIQAYVLNSLSSTLPAQEVQITDWPELSTLRLADPSFGKPQRIDMLLGAEIYGRILENGVIRNPLGTLTAQNTSLGWILSGRLGSVSNSNNHCSHTIINFHVEDHSVNELLRKFWEIETDESRGKILSPDDQMCEKIFESTTTRDESGRYIVRLPFRSKKPECRLGDFRPIALKRFEQLEKKLDRNPVLKSEYSRVINEYIDMQHMEPVPDEDIKSESVYLPHHSVIREDKTTTKVRVVFDASCKGVNGKSLNDDLLIGPRLQPDLRHLLLKWRNNRICFVADVIKMYRQVKVAQEDTNYQRLLWRENPKDDVKDYRLLRVTFGVSSAPYLAVKSLQQTSKDYGVEYPLAAAGVVKDFYMDDFVSGCETESEAIEIYHQTKEILKKGGFELQKWASNSAEVIKEFWNGEGAMREENLEFKSDDIVKILGLSWNINNDTFEYTVKLPPQKQPITKRVILSDISRLFDPLGWISPVIIQAKIYMQKLWLEGLQWDNEVKDELLQEWTTFRAKLPMLNKFEIPRWVQLSKQCNKEVHGFCDASSNAYAAVVYLRVVDQHGDVSVNLITSRTKVAPTSPVSIPRLELLGAHLLANLLKEVSTVMEIPKSELHAWTDSTVVLAWLRGHPCRWKTYVANRVTDILSILDNDQWSHVESAQNPADCASRGLSPEEFLEHELWRRGPCWLRQQRYHIPRDQNVSTNLEIKPIKSHVIVSTSNEYDHPVWTKFSSLNKLKRVIALCLKFKKLTLNKETDLPRYPAVNELDDALILCLKVCQNSAFFDDLNYLKKTMSVPPKSRLSSLCPFLDNYGIMRVRGRIQKSDENYNVKHPIILPAEHHISKLIVAEAHENTLHGGPQLTLNYLRSKYWVLNAKGLIRILIRKCVKCIRYRASNPHPIMGELPSSRVTISRPFSRSGVDYAGPINVRISKGRGCRCYKGYICLFVCMVTRAIHLEAVSDLTTEGFLAAFKRFVARRGHCHEVWSDNGTNFVGASKVLQSLFEGKNSSVMDGVRRVLVSRGIEWHFIPPHAPNFGGLWEAGVRSTKFHLRRILDGTTLTFEELSTVLAQVEACLNSRPMYRLPSNLEDPTPLTPGHFLVGEPLVTVPDRDYEEQNVGILRRWQLTQKLVQQFWRKWSQEYLTTLNQRYKWTRVNPEPRVGDIVLIREDGLPPCRWLFGLIEQKHPGPDNVTRVVTLRCKDSKIKRPVSKLCVLPIAD